MTKKTTIQESYTTRSARAVFLWTFFSLGLYGIYWSYRHWKEVGERDKRNTHPILATIFLLFTIYPLMLNFQRLYIKDGVKLYPGTLATIYALVSLGSYALSRLPSGPYYALALIGSLLIGAAVFAYAQHAINKSIAVKAGKAKRYSGGELAWIIVGVILFLPTIAGSFIPQSTIDSWEASLNAQEAELNKMLEEQEQKIEGSSQLKAKADRLYAEYDACFASAEQFTSELPAEPTDDQIKQSDDMYAKCEEIRVQQNNAADEYNRAIE